MTIGFLQNLAKAKFMNQKMDNRPIEHKPSTKLLGVHIDERLTWDDQIKHISSKVSMQNRGARIVTRADYSISSSDVLSSLEWSNLVERRKRHLLVTMFKVFNNNCPTYLRERFHRTS